MTLRTLEPLSSRLRVLPAPAPRTRARPRRYVLLAAALLALPLTHHIVSYIVLVLTTAADAALAARDAVYSAYEQGVFVFTTAAEACEPLPGPYLEAAGAPSAAGPTDSRGLCREGFTSYSSISSLAFSGAGLGSGSGSFPSNLSALSGGSGEHGALGAARDLPTQHYDELVTPRTRRRTISLSDSFGNFASLLERAGAMEAAGRVRAQEEAAAQQRLGGKRQFSTVAEEGGSGGQWDLEDEGEEARQGGEGGGIGVAPAAPSAARAIVSTEELESLNQMPPPPRCRRSLSVRYSAEDVRKLGGGEGAPGVEMAELARLPSVGGSQLVNSAAERAAARELDEMLRSSDAFDDDDDDADGDGDEWYADELGEDTGGGGPELLLMDEGSKVLSAWSRPPWISPDLA